MANVYCKKDFEVLELKLSKLKGKCPGEWAKVVTGWSKVDMFCDNCDFPIGVGEQARYAIYLAESLRDPLTEVSLFQSDGMTESVFAL